MSEPTLPQRWAFVVRDELDGSLLLHHRPRVTVSIQFVLSPGRQAGEGVCPSAVYPLPVMPVR